jgi:hypothetical protein
MMENVDNVVMEWYKGLLYDFSVASMQTFLESEELNRQAQEAIQAGHSSAHLQLRLALQIQSQFYRNHFKVLQSELAGACQSLEESGDYQTTECLGAQHDNFDSVLKSWHLMEIFILIPSRFVVVDFVAWLQVSEACTVN